MEKPNKIRKGGILMDSYYSRYLEEKAAHQAGTELEFVAKKGEQITPINQATLTSDQERVSEILDNKEELCEKDVNVLIDKHPDAIGLVEIEKAREQETDHESCDFNEDVVPSNPLCQPDQHPGVSITFVDPAGIEFEPVRDTEENLRQLQIYKNRVRGQRSQETCTKCIFENVVDIVVNGNYSYPADTIQKWARRSICQMTDPWSMNYNPERAAAISDMLFRFFINKRKPLKPDNRYFVREKNGEIFLKRDRGDIDTLHEYAFTHEDEDGNTHATRITMTEAEKEKMTNILRELNVQFVVRDLVDILR